MATHINPASNQILVWERGFQSLTIWLGRDAKIDFDKPLKLQVNGPALFNRKVTPSLATLLEDYLQRGDRQRLFVARIDVKPMP